MTPLGKTLIVLLVLITRAHLVRGQETEDPPTKTSEFPSPDGQFAFRYAGSSEEGEKPTYELIEKASGKVVQTVAESDPGIGPSARFHITVLWRPNSKAFALTALLWKRGTSLTVFARDGSVFRKIEVPELSLDIPESATKGKSFPHMVELDSESAKRWQKDGSLVAQIETIVDGQGLTLTATRTVVLGFDQSAKAKILKSTVKFRTEKQ